MTDETERRKRPPMNDNSLVPEQELEDDLRQVAARMDPVPDALLRAAESAFAWRSVDTELAQLAFDSLADRESLALVRGAEPRLLTFHAADLTIELEVLPPGPEHTRAAAAGHQVVGQLLPPGPARVELRHPDGVLAVEADELGRFAVDGVAGGPVSLRCQQAGDAGEPGAPIVTEWVPI
jgi:hypothetical protein